MYRVAERLMRRLERERGLQGLCDNLLPIIENAIVGAVPNQSLIPPEVHEDLRRLWNFYEQNRGRL